MYESCNYAKTYTLPFTAWDLRLYLNTHPNDACALATYRALCERSGGNSYASLPAHETEGGYHWINDKWPWEYGASYQNGCQGR